MKKLVVTYSHGYGCTWYADEVVPILYESEEALLVDLEEHCLRYLTAHWSEALNMEDFKGTGMQASTFIENGKYCAPTIRTLEQWFEDEVARC